MDVNNLPLTVHRLRKWYHHFAICMKTVLVKRNKVGAIEVVQLCEWKLKLATHVLVAANSVWQEVSNRAREDNEERRR